MCNIWLNDFGQKIKNFWSWEFIGFITRFLAPMTNLFRPTVKPLPTAETCLGKRPTNDTAQRINRNETSESISVIF